ncbi:hypothetical protein WMY93_002777 [Mugilogobius chulae]|uniref:Reverse transcriptase domain-containing protein n=1 Tax=Mugilogobius chulae TaxID=88201 RepID=A0AAW0Q0L6_9GOBI
MALPRGRRCGALGAKLLIFLLFFAFICRVEATVRLVGQYDRATLLKLRDLSHLGHFESNVLSLCPELARNTATSPPERKQKRRRGRRGGAARRLRRQVSSGRLTLPVVLFANVQSLENKMDELHTRISTQKDIRDCSMLCFCETWLGEKTPDAAVTPDGYSVYRGDRSAVESGKTEERWHSSSNPGVLTVTHSQVQKALKQVNPHKAVGPDGVSPRVLKTCGEQLAGVYTDIFNWSLMEAVVPRIFKSSVIVPVPKKTFISTLNDYRPVALTPVAMKCLEKLVLVHLNNIVPDTIDLLQFAYRPNRSVDDAVSVALHHVLQHLDYSGTYVRTLFLDYSSAFNTIRPVRLIEKLAELGIPTPTCNWILDFLIERPQVVRIGQQVSDQLTLSTGSPQGCCLSPKLFTLYTHDCVSKHNNTIIIKYADDTTILVLSEGG